LSSGANVGVAALWHARVILSTAENLDLGAERPSTKRIRMNDTHALRAFGAYAARDESPRQWLASLAASSGIYVLLGVLVVLIGSATQRLVREKPVDITFVEKVVQEPPPPPPPAPVEVKPVAPAAAAPVVRPDQKIRKLDKPPPPKEMVAPKDMPKEAAPEADPSQDEGVAVFGEGKGDPAGLEGGVAQGGVVGGMVGGAIGLPEDAVPPMPDKENAIPPYPQEARAAGRTGTVVLKVVILADGRVADVQVMRGEEPFVSAAVATVKKWKYTPALHKGQPITVYRIIQIPFKLTA
jgi:periplasmic protein TonB